MIFTALLYNAAMLLALGFLYSLIARHWEQGRAAGQIYKGLLFGGVALGVMASPVPLTPGIFFDTRSVVVSVAGLFGGPVTASIAVVFAGAYRIWAGGSGAFTGVLVIFVSGLLGTTYYFWNKRRNQAMGPARLYGFGLLVHAAMLLCMLTLPGPVALAVLKKISLPVLLIYPVVTLLLALMLAESEASLEVTRALADSARRFSSCFDNANIGMVITGIDGLLLEVNDQFCKMLGYGSQELEGKYFNDITHPDDFKIGKEFVEKTIAGNVQAARFEKRYLHKDGSAVWVRVSASLVRDTKGAPLHFISHVQDISESRRAEQALRESEARYRRIIETANEGVWTVDAQHNTTFVNARMAQMLGYSVEEMLGQPVQHFMPDEELDDHQSKVSERQRGQSGRFKRRLRRKDGGDCWCMASVKSLIDEKGRFDGALGMFTDITERNKAEEARHDALLRQREVVKAANVGLWDWDLITNKVRFSAEWKSQIGYEEHELDDDFEEWQSRVHPDDLESTIELVQRSIDEGRSDYQAEFRLRHKDGSYRWILAQGSVFQDETGRPVSMLGSHIDITERKQVEQALRASENKLKEAQKIAQLGWWSFDLKTERMFWSEEIRKVYEIEEEEIDHQKRFEFIHPDDREYLAGLREKLLADGSAEFEHRIVLSDGRVKWLWGKGQTRYDQDGNPDQIIGVAQNITARKKAEIALGESEERFKRALENIPDVLVIYGPDLRIRYINSATSRLTGRPTSDFIGKSDDELWPPESYQAYLPTLQEAAETLTIRSVETEFLLPDGKALYLKITCVPLTDEKGRLREILGITHNLTEYKRAEQERSKLESQLRQAQKMEGIGTLAGGIAHDFNNILAAIIGYTELAMDDVQDDNDPVSNLAQVMMAGNRAKKLVQQILSFSKQGDLESVPLRIGPMVKETLKLIRASIPTTIEITEKIAPEPKTILADPVQIHQVVLNLCTNAAQAMGEKGGVLDVQVSTVEMGDEQINGYVGVSAGTYQRLTISDTGAGMDKNTLHKIFDPFFTTKETGTGMGLSVVHGIVTQHGGKVTVYSEPGQGTTVNVYLPVIEAEEEITNDFEPAAEQKGNEKILLVDDEQVLVDLGRKTLEKRGYEVTALSSSLEALELFKAQPDAFDLVITDYTMPKMNGLDLAKEILRLRPEIPIIMCTGFSEHVSAERAAQSGIKRFVMKPILSGKIATTIREVLGGQPN